MKRSGEAVFKDFRIGLKIKYKQGAMERNWDVLIWMGSLPVRCR